MKKSKKATSIVEAMIILLIISSWVTWMYLIFSKSNQLSGSIKNKIYWIQIAKQWIEAFTNIRNTNWLQFPSDYKNCWNTLNYNINCIWDNTTNYDIQSWSYIIYKWNNDLWYLSGATSWTFWNWTYINDYKIWLKNWIYSQSGSTEELLPIFTRELRISYLDEDWTLWTDSNSVKIKVISLVQWVDSSSQNPHKVELEQILSNWKQYK